LIKALTATSKVFNIVFLSILRHVPLLWSNIETLRVVFADGCSSASSVRLREYVLAGNSWHVACVAWHMLKVDLVVRAPNPVLGAFAPITED